MKHHAVLLLRVILIVSLLQKHLKFALLLPLRVNVLTAFGSDTLVKSFWFIQQADDEEEHDYSTND